MIDYKLIRSKRRTVAIEIRPGGEVIVRSPVGVPKKYIDDVVNKKEEWIQSHQKKLLEIKPKNYSQEEVNRLKKLAMEHIPPRVEHYSKLMGLTPSGVKITSAKKRFGSCNYKNNLCFSLYLMEYPCEAIDYVVVHELAHIEEKNHGKNFYAIIEKILPDYKNRIKLLKNKTAD